jgi:hypothetical protein
MRRSQLIANPEAIVTDIEMPTSASLLTNVEMFINETLEEARKQGHVIECSGRNGMQINFGNKKLHEGHLRKLYPDILRPNAHIARLIDVVAPGRPCTHKPMREIIHSLMRAESSVVPLRVQEQARA